METKVAGTEMTLAEVARVEGADPAEVRAIGAIELGYAPAPGYSRLLRAERLEQLVRRKAPDVEVLFVGERACRVRPEVLEISGEEIAAAAHMELLRAFAGRDASFVPSDEVQGVAIPAGSRAPEVRARVQGKPSVTGLLAVPVDVLVDGVPYRTVWTSWTTEVWETVPVLDRPVRAGEEIRPDMLARQRVLREASGPVEPLATGQMVGSVARRDLLPGAVLTHLDVHRPTVVEVGSSVFLRVRKGSISATVAAVAMGSGAIGDRIRVRGLDSGLDLNAKIVSRDVVELDLGK